MASGIYLILNKINNKYYVGYTNNFYDRKKEHFSLLKRNKHHCIHLQNAVNLYGINNFDFVEWEEYPDEGFILPSMEHYWCNLLDAHNPEYGYNDKLTHPYNKGGNGKGFKNPKTIIKLGDIEQINLLILEGYSYNEIEIKLGFRKNYLLNKRSTKKFNKLLETLILPDYTSKRHKNATQDFVNDINKLIQEGLMDFEIEKKLDLPEKYITEMRRMKKFSQFKIKKANVYQKLNKKDRENILILRKEGKILKDIANLYKVRISAISYILSKN